MDDRVSSERVAHAFRAGETALTLLGETKATEVDAAALEMDGAAPTFYATKRRK